MGVIAKYKFDSSLCADFIPEFNSEFTGYTTSDVDNGDNTITRTISHDTLKPTLMRFGNGRNVTDRETSLLQVIESDTNNITNMSNMFRNCTNLTSLDLSNFDTSSTTNMSNMFRNCTNLTSLDLSNFDTSNVTNMSNMFNNCNKLTSLDLSNFDTSKVTSMDYMFQNCYLLTSLDLSNFDTSNVVYMNSIFSNCNRLTSLNLSSFNTSKVINMNYMFENCSSLNPLNVSSFNTSKVTTMQYMFYNCSSLTSLDLSSFNTSKVNNMQAMFNGCSLLTSLDISNFDTSKVTDMQNMFNNCKSLTTLDLSNFNTSNVTDMNSMFHSCSSLTSLDLSSFNTSKVTNMAWIFFSCFSLTTLDVSNFDTSKVTVMNNMFYNCKELISLDLSNFNTSNVTTMQDMFYNCNKLTSLDVSIFDTSSVTAMKYMFQACSSLTSLDLSNFNTSQVTDMSYMFDGCSKLTSLDLSNFDTSKVTSMEYMFRSCSLLTSIGLLYASSSTINSLLTPLGTSTARNIYYLDADPSELTAQDNINYVEYKESVVEIPSEIVLRSLPNGIKDTLSLKTGRYVKRIGEVVLNGSENWKYDSGYNYFYLTKGALNVPYQKPFSVPLCDKIKGAETLSTSKCIKCGDAYIFQISNYDYTNTSDLKSWLQSNPLTVQYELATPVETYIDLQKLPLSYTNGTLQLSAQSILPTLKYSVQTNKYEVPELLANTNYTIKSNEEQFIFDNYIQRGYTSNEVTETDSSSTKVTLNATIVNSDGETVTDTSVRVEDGEPEVLRIEGQTYQNLITESSETDYAVLDLAADIDAQTATINNTVQGGIHGAILKGQTLVNIINYSSVKNSSGCTIIKNNDTITVTSQTSFTWLRGYYNLNITYDKKYIMMWDSLEYTHTSSGGITNLIGVWGHSDDGSQYEVKAIKQGQTNNYLIFSIPNTSPINLSRVTVRIHATTDVAEVGATTTIKGLKIMEYQEGMENWDIPYFEGMKSVEVPSVKTIGKNLLNLSSLPNSCSVRDGGYYIDVTPNKGGANFNLFSETTGLNAVQQDVSNFIMLKPNTTYTLSKDIKNSVNLSGSVFDLDGNRIFGTAALSSNISSRTFTTTEDAIYFAPILTAATINETSTIIGLKLEEGSDATTYEPYKSSTLTTPSDVVLRKVGDVQDELDLETGKLTKNTNVMDDLGNYDMPSFTIHDWTDSSAFPVLKISFKLPVTAVNTAYGATSNFPLICDKFKVRGDENGYSVDRGTYVSTRNGQLFLHLIKEEVGLPTDVQINQSHVQNYFKDNPIKIIYRTQQPIIKTVDLSIVDQDNNPLSTIQTHPTVTHVSTSSQGLIPNVLIPQLKYPTLIKPSTQYTVQLKSTTFNTENPLTINLGGTTMTVPSAKFTITTPNTLTSQDVIFTGRNNVIGEVVVIEGNLVNKSLPFFEGIKSSFEGESSIEIKTTGKNLFDLRQTVKSVLNPSHNNITNYTEYGNNGFSFNITFQDWRGVQLNGLDPQKTYIISYEKQTTATTGEPSTIDVYKHDKDNKYAHISRNNKSADWSMFTNAKSMGLQGISDRSGKVNNVKIYNIQLEEVTSVTPYEPYKSTTTTLNITEPLRSLPNGVRDKVIFKDGVAKLIRRVGKVILDGSEGWQINTGYIHSDIIEFITYNELYNASISINEKFINDGENTERLAGLDNGSFYLRINKNRLDSLDESGIQKYLQNNPITVYCAYKTPNTTPLSISDLPYLYKDGHIFTNTDYPAKLVYKPKTARYMLKTTDQNSTTKIFYADDPNIVLLEGNKLACKIPTFQGLCSADFKGVNNCALSSSVVLRRLPDGTCDTFNALTGVITRNIGYIRLNKNSNVSTLSDPNIDTCCYINVPHMAADSVNLSILQHNCSLLKVTSGHKLYNSLDTGLGVTGNQIRIKFTDNSDTPEDIKQWLTENPVDVIYKLATPTYTSISDILKPQASPNGTIYLDTTNQSINPVFKYRMPTTNFYQLNMDSNSTYTVQAQGTYTLNGTTTNVSGSTTINSSSTVIDL